MRLTPGKRHAHLGSTRVIPESARIKLHGSKELSQPALQTVPAQRFSEIDSTTSGQGWESSGDTRRHLRSSPSPP